MSALTDHVLGAVLYSVIERGSWAATTEFKLNLLAPIRGGTVRAEAQIISMSNESRWSASTSPTTSASPAPVRAPCS